MRPTLSDCIELVLAQVDTLAADVLDALQHHAAEPARDDASAEIRAGVERTVAELKAESGAVRATLGAELRRLVYHSGARDFVPRASALFEDLRLSDLREIEVHIELALARQEVARAVDDVLPQFDSLVSALLGWGTVQSALNPLRPEVFERALLETMGAWVPDEITRMTLLRPAAIALGASLHQLYREACEWMRSQGVEPVDSQAGRAQDARSVGGSGARTEVERTMQTLDKLRRLLGGVSHPGVGGVLGPGGERDYTHTVPGSMVALQDLKLIEPMMKRLAQRPVRSIVGRAAQSPIAPAAETPMAGDPGSQAYNQQIGHLLGAEVVNLMVDQLVSDGRLQAPVRMQLRSLEPALLQLAKADPRFFIDRRHPARQLLDRVVQRSLALSSDDESAMADFTSCVSDAINDLMRGAGDAASYAGVLDALEKAWHARDADRSRRRDEELLAREHAHQRRVVAQRFSQALMDRFSSAALPELVASFLRGPWSQVLAESHLRGEQSELDSHGYLALADDLVWSVQLPLVRRDYARLVRLIPRLLSRIHEGLALVHYPQEPVSIFLDDLSALHEQVLADHRRAVAAARAAAQEAGAATPAEIPERRRRRGSADPRGAGAPERRQRMVAGSAIDPDALAAREQLAGARVDLLLSGQWVRARLTWVSRNRNLFMFVSGAGLAHAMSRRTMLRLEAQDRIRVVAPAFDLVIESGVAPLDQADAESGPIPKPLP